MMTFRVGAAGGKTVSAAIAEYYLADTLRSENMRPAEYYLGRQEQADGFWNNEVIDGRLEMGRHRAELRSDLSPALAARLGLHGQDLTQERVANLLSLRQAGGERIDGRQIHRPHADGKKPPVGFLDLTLSAPKSLSVAWGLASTKEERDKLLAIHRVSVDKTMKYVSEEIGYTQRGGRKNRRSEFGDIAWLGFQHYTSRPVGDHASDPQLHTHAIVLPHVLTEGGHIGALDLDRLSGRIKEFGYVYQAHVAEESRKLGIRVEVDERTSTARFSDIPTPVLDLFSKRTNEAIENAVEHAKRMGLDWGELSEDRKAGLIRAGAHTARQQKDEINDLASWSLQADKAGYRYKSVLGRAEMAEVPDEVRTQSAYQEALPRLENEFRRRSVLDENEIRRVAAQAFVSTGIKDAGSDLDAVMKSFRRDGVDHDGQRVSLVSQEAVSVRGKERTRVTTTLHVAQEQELIRLAKTAAADLSGALAQGKVARAADAFLARHPEIDREGEHWQAQRGMIDHIASGGRLSVVIGVPGAGKSFTLAAPVQAWKDEGRQVYGVSLAWRQAADLRAAGIEERVSLAAFLSRVESGHYRLDRNSVVVVDEVGLVGSRQMLDLLRVQERTGARVVMIGDPRQNQPIEGASGLELLREALGEDAVPRLLRSARQDTERERDIAALLRRGKADEALEMKRQDGTALLVAGGRAATVRRVAELWRERVEQHYGDPGFTLTISAPTNADARELGAAIRAEWRAAGHLGADLWTARATDRTGASYDLPLAIGDRVRLFDRIYEADTPGRTRRALASNGDVVEVRHLGSGGMRVRNAAGSEGLIEWSKLRSGPNDPVRLAYGYALTVDTAQGSTATEHIHALPSGSQATHGFKAYTAATRHRRVNWLVIDEASERQQILDTSMLGHRVDVTEQDIWKQVASSVSKYPQKPSAISVMQRRA